MKAFTWLACALAILIGLPAGLLGQDRVLDACDATDGWKVIAAEGVRGSVGLSSAGIGGSCLALSFEFVTGGGYCILQKPFPMDLPENYEFTFQVRAAPGTPENNLEFKLLDESGDNVWWVNRRGFAFPTQWQRMVNKKRHIEFAWGPAGAATPLKKLGKVELVIASSSGGKGTVYFDDLRFRELPRSVPYAGKPVATSTDWRNDREPAKAIDGDPATFWEGAHAQVGNGPTALTIDFGATREFGGLSIHWAEGLAPPAFDVLTSDDGTNWATAYQAKLTSPRTNHVPMPDAECRYVRIDARRHAWPGSVTEQLAPATASPGKAGIAEVIIRDSEFGEPNKMFETIAKESPRGLYPKYFLGEQRYWTVAGDLEGGEREALLSEDGAVEFDRRSFSIEPFVQIGTKIHSWADANYRAETGPLGLVPRVTGNAAGVEISIQPFTRSHGPDAALYVLYTFRNKTEQPITGRLHLAIRPFQVNPPSQWLNSPGGASRITALRSNAMNVVSVSGQARVTMLGADANVTMRMFDEADSVAALFAGGPSEARGFDDPRGLASGMMDTGLDLAPGAETTIGVAVAALEGQEDWPRPAALITSENLWSLFTEYREGLLGKLQRVRFDLPPSALPIWNAARAQIAYILINRDGPAIQPGSRSYERSWARDGSMTSAALLEFGHPEVVKQWIEWFAANQFESGKVPCVVDKRGPDPVNEHDSHGQLIFAVANYYKYTRDAEFLRRLWPNVQKAVAYIETIRAERMTPEFRPDSENRATPRTRQEPGKPPVPLAAFFGLVPESISHEGYSAKPMHSYWDDFFVLLGLKDAAFIAGELGERDAAARYAALAADFRRTLLSSIALTQQAHAINYIPGCVELGDFDATSTTVALWPCGEGDHLPPAALRATFDRYWEFFVKRRDDATFPWVDYTPYEHRVIGSFIRLGQRERALALIDFFMQGRRPAAWNQWPEIVYRDPATPKFLGDLPHTWCGSDFLNSFRALFVHERETERGDALVLLAGVPERWLTEAAASRETGGDGTVGFRDLPTPWGKLSCAARLIQSTDARGDTFAEVTISGLEREPPGGVWIANPFDESRPPIEAKPDATPDPKAPRRVRIVK